MCAACKSGYAKVGGECKGCLSEEFNIVLTIALLIAIVTIVSLLVRGNLVRTSKSF